MERRKFLRQVVSIPAVGLVALRLTGCGADQQPSSRALAAEKAPPAGSKSFGYYQGLGEDETRSPSRPDGTYYDMPCILRTDIDAGVTKDFLFWHGHGGGKHAFTVTAEHFTELKAGRSVELFTSIIDGHRHALRITPTEACDANCALG